MTSTPRESDFYPFFDPQRDGRVLSWGTKTGIALSAGAVYMLLQYVSLSNKMDFFDQYCWVLGCVISTALMAVYVSTEVFRNNLVTMHELEMNYSASDEIIANWLTDRWYLIAGLGFATCNTTVGHLLGVPAVFHENAFSLTAIYLGMFLAGFSSGMGLLGITAIIVLYLRFAPNLHHSLNPHNPDGIGGIKKLGDSLWFFGALTGLVGILVSIYMFGVDWTNDYKSYAQNLFLLWVSLPYVFAISIVLIPGLAVRRQISYFKYYKEKQLKREKAQLYASFKKFDDMEDEELINEKRELLERINEIQDELVKLRNMRNSHLDR